MVDGEFPKKIDCTLWMKSYFSCWICQNYETLKLFLF